MGSEAPPLHILFFPLMAAGHMLPMVDMAKLFAGRGVKATVLTTPANAPTVEAAIEGANRSYAHPIHVALAPFPSAAVGLPEGCENLSSVPFDEHATFMAAVVMLEEPFRRVLADARPDAVVTDMFLPWTLRVAEELSIPRLVFHGTSFTSLCVSESMGWNKPPPDSESFVIPNLPHRIEMLRSQVPDLTKAHPLLRALFDQIADADRRNYGVVANSFYELEPDYADHYRKVAGRRAWHVGPVSLVANKRVQERATRGSGKKAGADHTACLRWLDGKEPGSVVYVCFGSMVELDRAQLRELALGLERCGHDFVWVVKGDERMPPGFEGRVAGRGLVLRGWAPQILVLSHRAVGGFVTHCGWNSTLEAVAAGVPMVTWPFFAEQFYNEKLVVEVVRIGVGVGIKLHSSKQEERQLVEAGEIERAVRRIMDGGEEAEGMRRRAKELALMAERAVEEGGSSYVDLNNLIQELTERRAMIERR